MKFIQKFIQSAGVLLLAAALVSFLGNLAGLGHLHPHDPLLAVSMPVLFWIFGGVALAIAWLCLFGRKASIQLGAVLWFAANLCVYQFGVLWQNPRSFSACLLDAAAAFGVSHDLVNFTLRSLTLYLLFGSIYCLFQLRFGRSAHAQTAAAGFQKTSCPACGVRIMFNNCNLGQTIPCPHCQKTLTLCQPAMLKMSCFFCKEHIEFPYHATGTKMACPHCRMDITLKELP